AIPPSSFDAGLLVADAGIDPEHLCGYFGLYRLLLADLVVLTMCEETLGRSQLAAVERCARSRPLSHPKVVCTVFRPHPLADVTGKRIWFGTTAVERAGPALKQHLEGTYGCDVVAVSHALARRDALRRDLEDQTSSRGVDALVVELKAAAVDVVTRWGTERGIEVIYLDNRPETVGGPDHQRRTALPGGLAAGGDRRASRQHIPAVAGSRGVGPAPDHPARGRHRRRQVDDRHAACGPVGYHKGDFDRCDP